MVLHRTLVSRTIPRSLQLASSQAIGPKVLISITFLLPPPFPSHSATYDKLYKEVPSYKLITPSVVSERLKIRGSLARFALQELETKGLIRLVDKHHAQFIYTRNTKAEDDEEPKA